MARLLTKETSLKRQHGIFTIVGKTIRECQQGATPIEVERLMRLSFMLVDVIQRSDKQFDGKRFLEIAGFGDPKAPKPDAVTIEATL